MSPNRADRFDTASLRAAVLDAWRSSPTRYREDANVEEDYALGGYRDRVIVELAQNAVDAARAAGVPARIRVTVHDDRLEVANTGAPLDRAGVESLASMRASSKRDETVVGRFGVGFAAVLAVTDEPMVVSGDQGVRFSRDETSALMRRDAVLSAALDDRAPPVLRLPFPAHPKSRMSVDDSVDPAGGYDTTVVLPWRDTAARDRALDALRAIDDALFIALPGLVEVLVDGAPSDIARRWTASTDGAGLDVTVDGATRHWRLFTNSGEWSAADLVDAPTEQRDRRSWQLTWAIPLSPSGTPAGWPVATNRWPLRVVHAPTPTDEALEFPALLVGDFPVDSSRRRLAPGAMTDVMIDAAVDSYVEVVREVAVSAGVDAALLVPEASLVGSLDGRVREGVRDLLGRTPWVPRASDASPAMPRELVTVDPSAPELVQVLAPYVSDLLSPSWLGQTPTLRSLGLSSRRWSDVWDVVATLSLSAETWHAVYSAAADLDRSALEGLPILLADGRMVRDARQCVVPGAESLVDAMNLLGLAVIDATAMHPLLERLGAQSFDPRLHLAELPVLVRHAVADDEGRARQLLTAAASLLDGGEVRPADLVDLGSTLVPTSDRTWTVAAQVVLPGTPLASAVDTAPLLDDSLASEHREGWLGLGVLGTLTVVVMSEIPMDPSLWDTVMVDGGSWCEDTADLLDTSSAGDLLVTETAVVRGIELLERCDAETALTLIGAHEVRKAIIEPTTVIDAIGRARSVSSPAAWWLSETPLFDGRAPTALRLPGDERLAPFFAIVDLHGQADLELLEAVGMHTTLDRWLRTPDGAHDLLVAMADDATDIPDHLVRQLYTALRKCPAGDSSLAAPERLRARVERTWRVVDGSDALVAVAPHHAYVTTSPYIPGDEPLADLLDVDVTDDASCGAESIANTGSLRDLPAEIAALVPIGQYREHDTLAVGGRDVEWWVTDDDEVHACTLDGVAQATAWASGQWSRRWELMARLSGHTDDDREQLDAAYDD